MKNNNQYLREISKFKWLGDSHLIYQMDSLHYMSIFICPQTTDLHNHSYDSKTEQFHKMVDAFIFQILKSTHKGEVYPLVPSWPITPLSIKELLFMANFLSKNHKKEWRSCSKKSPFYNLYHILKSQLKKQIS